jgi:hypothetical protein
MVPRPEWKGASDDGSENSATVGRILELAAKRQWDEWATPFHEDLVIEWPQSGERIEGRDKAADFHSNLPEGGADMTLLNVRGGGDVVISEVKVDYADGSTWYWANIYEDVSTDEAPLQRITVPLAARPLSEGAANGAKGSAEETVVSAPEAPGR